MYFEFKKKYWVGIIAALIVVALDFYFFFSPITRWFKPLLGIAAVIAIIQIWLDFLVKSKKEKQIELQFLEFSRALVGSVKSGIPVPKAILEVSKTDYGPLDKNVKKLARQIEWGTPMREALKIFALDTGNKVIKRSIAIVIEAEESGGNMHEVLESVTRSIVDIKSLREERRASVYSQIVQGYMIYFIFLVIMLVLQLKLMPQLTQITGLSLTGSEIPGVGLDAKQQSLNFNEIFLSLLLIQGFFTGLMTGKFSEGDYKSGIKHVMILMAIAYIVYTTFVGV